MKDDLCPGDLAVVYHHARVKHEIVEVVNQGVYDPMGGTSDVHWATRNFFEDDEFYGVVLAVVPWSSVSNFERDIPDDRDRHDGKDFLRCDVVLLNIFSVKVSLGEAPGYDGYVFRGPEDDMLQRFQHGTLCMVPRFRGFANVKRAT